MKKRAVRRGSPRLAHGRSIAVTRRALYAHYTQHGRHHLPWRKTADPYQILVSEVMLQQTQVDRAIPYFTEFVRRFPTPYKLAGAELKEVLELWGGLGYNRRAKFLHDAAKMLLERHCGEVPRGYAELRALPGVGEYTAKAVRVFAFGKAEVLVETNVRTVVLHHLFPGESGVGEAEVCRAATLLAQGQPPARFHAAIMDYGTHLKKVVGNASRRSTSYKKQKPLKGSLREVRGAIVRELQDGPRTQPRLMGALPEDMRGRVAAALAGLVKDGLVRKDGRHFTL